MCVCRHGAGGRKSTGARGRQRRSEEKGGIVNICSTHRFPLIRYGVASSGDESDRTERKYKKKQDAPTRLSPEWKVTTTREEGKRSLTISRPVITIWHGAELPPCERTKTYRTEKGFGLGGRWRLRGRDTFSLTESNRFRSFVLFICGPFFTYLPRVGSESICQSVAAGGSMVEVNFQCYTCFSEFCVSLTHSLFFSLVMFVLLFYSFFLFYIPPSPSHTHTHTDTVSYNSILFSCG